MTTNQLGILICRIAAAYFVLQGINYYGFSIVYSIGTGNLLAQLLPGLGTMLPSVITGVAIWYLAPHIVRSLPESGERAAETGDTPDRPARDFELLVSAGLLLLGLYALMFGVLQFISMELSFIAADSAVPDDFPRDEAERMRRWPTRISYALRIAFGLFLVLGRDGIARFFRNLRYAGLEPSQN